MFQTEIREGSYSPGLEVHALENLARVAKNPPCSQEIAEQPPECRNTHMR